MASDDGLKSVTIHDGDRGILRRYRLGGEKEFAQEIVMSNSQQLAPSLVVEDVNGKRAISAAFWTRNLLKEEFLCTDRCNPLGNSRLRKKDNTGWTWTPVGFQNNLGVTASKGLLKIDLSPAVFRTPNSATNTLPRTSTASPPRSSAGATPWADGINWCPRPRSTASSAFTHGTG